MTTPEHPHGRTVQDAVVERWGSDAMRAARRQPAQGGNAPGAALRRAFDAAQGPSPARTEHHGRPPGPVQPGFAAPPPIPPMGPRPLTAPPQGPTAPPPVQPARRPVGTPPIAGPRLRQGPPAGSPGAATPSRLPAGPPIPASPAGREERPPRGGGVGRGRERGRRPLKGKGLPRPAMPLIELRSIDGHITRTSTEVMAWYVLAPQPWSFQPDTRRERLITNIAHQLGELAGRRLHLRVTSSPWPVPDWARAFDKNSADRPPDVPDTLSWRDFLRAEQQHLLALRLVDKLVYLGVEIGGRGLADRVLDRVAPMLRRVLPEVGQAELRALDADITFVDGVVGRSGLDARAATAEEMAWLMHRSARLGLPVPSRMLPAAGDRWDTEDLACFTDGVWMGNEPYDPVLQVIGRGEGPGPALERRVAVLTLGLMNDMRIPQSDDPWMLPPDRLPFPVEWSARIVIRRPEGVEGELQRQTGKVQSQVGHFTDDHDLEPPLALARQADRVQEIEDEMSRGGGLTHVSTRLHGWWRIAVTGTTEEEVLERARAVAEVYRPKVTVEQPEGQYQLAREFIPGEPLSSQAYKRHGSVMWAAAAVPAVSASVGDPDGIVLGETATGARRPVTWAPWRAQEVQQASGLTAIVGGLGAGKSYLTGVIVYKSLRAGARWTVLDPSGPLAKLAELPELAPFSRHVNLLDAQPGILNPYRVVAEPRLEFFAGEADPEATWQRERMLAAATRKRLTRDVLLGLLPFQVAQQSETQLAILTAVRAVGGGADREPGMVITELRAMAERGNPHAGGLADFLDERRELPQAALLFPLDGDTTDQWAADTDIRLTVLTMQGLTLPRPGSAREEWTDSEAVSVELLNVASWLTQRGVYDTDRNQRKGVALDETHFLSQVPTGKVLIDKLARDSRKFNVRALFASQLAGDLHRVPGFASLVNAVFVGRTDDQEAQEEALRLLKVPVGLGYEQMLAGLSPRPRDTATSSDLPRQFIFADGGGGIEQIHIDLRGPHMAHLRRALDTNPTGRRAAAPALAEAAATPGAPGPGEAPAPPPEFTGSGSVSALRAVAPARDTDNDDVARWMADLEEGPELQAALTSKEMA